MVRSLADRTFQLRFFYLQQQPIYLTSLCVPDAKKVEGLGDGGLGVRDELTAEECELVVRVTESGRRLSGAAS